VTDALAYDAIVIGSGFGGSMVAHKLLGAGRRVLMIERGDWVERGPHNWEPRGSLELTRHYAMDTPIHVVAGGYGKAIGGYHCVGGPSVFYGCVAFRFRERDFSPDPSIVADSGAAWPFGYAELEPYYAEAESLLQVSGDDGADPTRPRRSSPFPQAAPALARISRRIGDAARSLGLHPFALPLAINYQPGERRPCQACRTCDTFACAISAKNDLATMMIRPLVERGMALAANTVAARLVHERGRIVAVECFDKRRGERVTHRADVVALCAGTMSSPHLLLASGLHEHNPGGHVIGRYLTRHCNGMVFGVFPRRADPEHRFHKQLAIHDYYFGDDAARTGKLGGIQQVMTPPVELVKAHLPWGLRQVLAPLVEHLTGLLVMAEDQPRFANGITVDWSHTDRYGLPKLSVDTRYTKRDAWARRELARRAKRVLRRAGAWLFHTHHIKTFSHAVGTVRVGTDPTSSALDPSCKFRGIDNLYVADGSFMPTSAGLNPSLTIAANALRVGARIVEEAA
jgi:choline dehydrogenase-like flavoprotein